MTNANIIHFQNAKGAASYMDAAVHAPEGQLTTNFADVVKATILAEYTSAERTVVTVAKGSEAGIAAQLKTKRLDPIKPIFVTALDNAAEAVNAPNAERGIHIFPEPAA